MQIVAIILAFWLALIAVYAGLVIMAGVRKRRLQRERTAGLGSAAVSARTGIPTDQPVLGGLFSEVDMLRVQVETLRSEVMSLTSASPGERPRLRRYRSGQYTQLPRQLRRQVREVRSYRHPMSA